MVGHVNDTHRGTAREHVPHLLVGQRIIVVGLGGFTVLILGRFISFIRRYTRPSRMDMQSSRARQIAVPLILQTFLIFLIAYGACKLLRLPHEIAAPAGMIGASNFFELAVAVAVALFGTTSPAALATTVGVLTEVPVMLTLVKIANQTKKYFR